MSRYLLGVDIGSSFVKASLLDIERGRSAGSASAPDLEMEIISDSPGWAEQHPERWWSALMTAILKLRTKTKVQGGEIAAIGISYQMHGLVAVDKHQKIVRPSIIWCDSRAVDIGKKAMNDLGHDRTRHRYLNSPGNFTASKLRWVMEHEPDVFKQIDKMMLPGDFIAMKMTGDIRTTVPGLSEAILWDYRQESLANDLLHYFDIPSRLIPDIAPTFGIQGTLTKKAAGELGLTQGLPVAYRAGDQPNNAFSLNVLDRGEIAATAGTSGVLYAITNRPDYDKKSRVNTFVHVNHIPDTPRYGVLLCINGAGALYRWLKNNLSGNNQPSYEQMNTMASGISIGADDLLMMPFGNGAERVLENRDIGASVHGLNFNRHNNAHIVRAALEGVVYSLTYGLQVMQEMSIETDTVKAGYANMFLSPVFREAFVNTTGSTLELYKTDGAEGAARGAGIGAGVYTSHKDAFLGLQKITTIKSNPNQRKHYLEVYERWLEELNRNIQSYSQ
ncbi:MAG: carbohydrate kinase [Bacteroidetes bacterium]|jgi:xylulokinase|nr:carbohydrate kinase [Bacteroidota bacterium]